MIKEDQYMFCSRCNNPLEENATFCGVCGLPLKASGNTGARIEMPGMQAHHSQGVLAPTLYVAPDASRWQKGSTMAEPENRLPDERLVSPRSRHDELLPPMVPD